MTSLTAPLESTSAPVAPAAPALRLVGLLAALGGIALAAAGVVAVDDGARDAGVWVRAVLVACWCLAGIVLVTREPRRLGLIAIGAGLVGGVCAATAPSDSLDELHALAACAVPAIALHLALALPNGTLGRAGRRNSVIAGYGAAVVAGIVLASGANRPSATWIAVATVAAIMMTLPAANQRYLTSAGAVRQRLQLVGCAVAVVVEVALLVAALRIFVEWPPSAGAVAAAATALVPLSLASGAASRIVRHVDRVLVHTVSITGLTAVVVLTYLLIVIGLGRVPDDTERTLLVLSMAAAAVAAVIYGPARERLAETANRLVYGERHPPDEVLRTWGSRLSRAIPMDELLLQLAESLRKVMALRRAEVWTGTPELLERAVSVPDQPSVAIPIGTKERPVIARAGVTGNAWLQIWLPALLEDRPASQVRVAPACHSGELLGLIVVERRVDDDHFDDEDDRVLTELARQVGLALHNVQLDSALQASLDDLRLANENLRASRARIVATADAERRKIERNLHDGAQQHLVALAVNLRLAKDVITDDPETATEMLEMLADSVKDTIQELRDLAHGIYPPLLMDSGLTEALRAAATRSPLDVGVEAEGVGRYNTEVEAAVYFCCLEALQNAAKHAPSAHVDVKVWEDDSTLRFEVHDDGPGFDPTTATAGHGYVNMSDRLGAIGGAVDWRSAPGEGATVSGTIPLEAET